MKEKLIQRVELLSAEADSLIAERQRINDEFNKIEVRLAQIVGAIQVLQSIIKASEDEQV